MIRRSARIFLEVLAAVVGLAVIVVGIAVWRLSTGPVEVAFLTPYVEQALGDREDGVDVEVGQTVLTWEGWPETLDLRARNVRVLQADGTRFLRLPAVSVRFSLRAALEGVIAATEIEVIGARLTLLRKADGRFDLAGASGVGSDGEEGTGDEGDAAAAAAAVPKALAEIMTAPDPSRPLSYLTSISLSQAVLVVKDEQLDHTWRARNVGLTLERARRGLSGYAALGLELPGNQVFASADLLYDAAAGRLEIDTQLLRLWPNDLAEVSRKLELLSGLNFPVNGRLAVVLSAEGRIQRIGFDIEATEGELSVPGWVPDPIPLQSARLRGELTQLGEQRLVVREAHIALNPPEAPETVLNARLTGWQEEVGTALKLDATVENFRMSALPKFWPEGILDNARTWLVTNIPSGGIDRIELESKLALPGADPELTQIDELAGSFEYTGLQVHYFPELQPITGIDGQATFDKAGVYLQPAGGKVGDLVLRESTVNLIGFDTTEQVAVVDVNVDGPVRRFLEILAHTRLDLLSGLGISAEGTEGSARVGAFFSIPLADAVTFDDITVKAQAQLSDATATAVMMGLDLTDGELDLVVDKAHMLLRGPGRIADVPLTFEWRENFSEGEKLARSVQATVPSLSDYGREVLGLEAAPYLTGPIALEVDYRAERGGAGQVAMQADFTTAGLSLPFMNWRKDSGEPAQGRGIVELDGDEIVHIGALEIDGERFHAEGDVYFAGDGAPERLSLSRFVAGRSDLHDLELVRREGGLHLTIGRGRLDARPFLEELETPAEAAEAASEDEDPPLLVEAPDLDPIVMGEGRRIDNASLKLERKHNGWVLISLRGDLPGKLRRAPRSKPGLDSEKNVQIPPPVPIQFYYGPDGNEGIALSADSEDFGATLRVFDLLDTIEGGQFQLRGGRPASAPNKPLKAALSVSKFNMVEAPIMARILSIASLTGAGDLLSGEGIRFTEASGNLKVKNGKISSKLLRAHGPALGLTAKGEVDLVADAIDVEGTVVPAYSVNRFLGKIPLLGRVLTGGEGEGVVAVTYKVRGPVTDPEVSVNPLSVLTPGFLRGVFNIFDGEAPPSDSDVSVYPEIQNTP